MPSADAFAGVKVHWDLTGDAVLPPRYAFGFMACRWGWQSEAYIEEMLTAFRTGGNTTGGGCKDLRTPKGSDGFLSVQNPSAYFAGTPSSTKISTTGNAL